VTEDFFRQRPVKVRGQHEIARAQPEWALRSIGGGHRFDLRHRALVPDDQKSFTALNAPKIAGRVAFDLLDTDEGHSVIVAWSAWRRQPLRILIAMPRT